MEALGSKKWEKLEEEGMRLSAGSLLPKGLNKGEEDVL
jgi:hypothetical protein